MSHDTTRKTESDPRILFREYGIELRAEAEDRLMLEVLCGRIGEYLVEFELTDDERRHCDAEGDEFVRSLAREVRKNPQRFSERKRLDTILRRPNGNTQ